MHPFFQGATFQTSFQDPGFRPPYTWKVAITAMCPKCGHEMILGNAESGEAAVKCTHCPFVEIQKNTTAQDLARAVMQHLCKDPETFKFMPGHPHHGKTKKP